MPDSLNSMNWFKQVADLKVIDWAIIVTALFTGLSLIQLWFIRKANKMNMPSIVSSKFTTRTMSGKVFSKEITITIVNPAQIGIVVNDVKLRKSFFGFFIKNIHLKSWNPPNSVEEISFGDGQKHYIPGDPKYLLMGQALYTLYLPLNVEESTYKISVKTTGGRCSTIYHPKQDNGVK